MKPLHHLLVVFICIGLLWYHLTVNAVIMNHPYMVGLMIVLILVGYWNLVLSITKSLRKN
jgi:hypothetical protein